MVTRVTIGTLAIERCNRGRRLPTQFHTEEAFFIATQLAFLAVNHPGFLFFDRTSGGKLGYRFAFGFFLLLSEQSKLLRGFLSNGGFFGTFGLEDRIEELDFIFLKRLELVPEFDRL